MKKCKATPAIPTSLSEKQFNEFILPHIPHGMRGPEKKLPAYRTFQYICRVLHTGMQWQELEIKLNEKEEAEIHYTTLWRTFKAWTEHNVFSLFFEYSVKALMLADKLDMSILHGDGTSTAASHGKPKAGVSSPR